MLPISWFISYLYFWILSSYILHKKLNKIPQQPDGPFVAFWNLKSFIQCHSLLFFVRRYSLSPVVPFVVTRWTTRSHISFVVILIIIPYHLLYQLLSLIVTWCTICCHSLSFVVTLCASLCHLLSLIVTRCTNRCHSVSLDLPLDVFCKFTLYEDPSNQNCQSKSYRTKANTQFFESISEKDG